MAPCLSTIRRRSYPVCRMVEGRRQPGRRDQVTHRALGRGAQMIRFGRGETVTAIGMATRTVGYTSVIHGCRLPSGSYGMAAAAGSAGHRRHGMRFDPRNRAAGG